MMMGVRMALQLLLLLLAAAAPSGGSVPVQPLTVGEVTIAVAPNAAVPELFAAQQLAQFLGLVAGGGGSAVPVLSPTAAVASGRPVLAVGAAAAVAVGVPLSRLAHLRLADDGYFCATAADFRTVALSGATRGNTTAPRGTINAVFEYLRALGFRHLAPNVTLSPGPVGTVRLVRCDGAHTPSFSFRLINPSFLRIGNPWPSVITDGAAAAP
eukprot:SAG31_NODE_13864_length_841_cov_1.525606_1_plen_211_part_10